MSKKHKDHKEEYYMSQELQEEIKDFNNAFTWGCIVGLLSILVILFLTLNLF